MCSVLGHGHPELVDIINSHAANLDHISSCMVSPPVIKLASRLTSALPPGLDRAFFLSTGAESNEAAIKLAKRYTGKFEVVGLGESWHGMTPIAQGVQYQAGRKGCGINDGPRTGLQKLICIGPSLPGQFMLPQPNPYRSRFRTSDGSYDWESELDYGWELIDQSSCGSLAACIVECIQGDAGIHVVPPGYLKALKVHCENRDMLLIVDEAQTGIGRTGDLFAIDHEGVVPHILTLSKTLGNGLPLSAVVMSAEIDAFGKENGFLFFTTHVNDPLSAAVGDKVLEIVMRCNTLENSRRRGQELFEGLQKLKERYGCIGDIRGRGLMAGVEIVSDRESKGPAIELGRELSENMLRRGLWSQLQTQRTGNGVFRIGPPIVSTEDQIHNGLNVMEDAFRSTPGTLPLY